MTRITRRSWFAAIAAVFAAKPAADMVSAYQLSSAVPPPEPLMPRPPFRCGNPECVICYPLITVDVMYGYAALSPPYGIRFSDSGVAEAFTQRTGKTVTWSKPYTLAAPRA